jgi:hypothetical protein
MDAKLEAMRAAHGVVGTSHSMTMIAMVAMIGLCFVVVLLLVRAGKARDEGMEEERTRVRELERLRGELRNDPQLKREVRDELREQLRNDPDLMARLIGDVAVPVRANVPAAVAPAPSPPRPMPAARLPNPLPEDPVQEGPDQSAGLSPED